ncbi:MAG TPA: hypothetical protein DDW42_07755 [Desulfobacteraceae bacterium]|nr:hypothetical protein [Desulfobacteraceae bacterium]
MKRILLILLTIAALSGQKLVLAKVDLAILPKRDTAQLTIYNSADLTLVRERRDLTLKKGSNHLQFSWANTLIDPTSLDILPTTNADKINVLSLTFPPRMRNLGIWNIQSRISGNVPVEITYLTSGLSWRAFYIGTLNSGEKTMRLKGYVRVTNRSGEAYENAQVRLIVGKINMVDKIANLARRQHPFGRPGQGLSAPMTATDDTISGAAKAKRVLMEAGKGMMAKPKEIKKEGLSEYFLYTIEGAETIPNGWSKRLPSFDIEQIRIVSLYKYEKERYGNQALRFLSFKNDKDHKLGDTPIPGGIIKVFRNVDQGGHLSYEGQSAFKYIPVDEDVELNLGAVSNVIVRPKLMDYKTEQYLFDHKGNIIGWDEIRDFEIEVKNTRRIPAKVEITRNFNTSSWDIKKTAFSGYYEKVDLDTVKFSLNLNAHETKRFNYTLTTHHGRRAD